MANQKMRTVVFPCHGGLNLSSSNQQVLNKPNEASILVNFEASRAGGYRRIDGFEQWGTEEVPGTGRIKGICNYAGEGIVACRGNDIYHSFDGTYWVQVNKVVTQVNEATLVGTAAAPRSSSVNRYFFQSRTQNNTTVLYMVDGIGNPMILLIEGLTRGTATYTYREITLASDLTGSAVSEMHRDQLCIAGSPLNPGTFYYSAFTDPLVGPVNGQPQEHFASAQAGAISVKDVIVGLKSFREVLYIFCVNSVWKAQGMDSGSPEVIPVTHDIGCVDGGTIQEIGGDLIFLAPDGLRSVAATDRIGDIELGVLSRKVAPLFNYLVDRKDVTTFYSTVIREKNQYRIWSYDSTNLAGSQRGIAATYRYSAETNGFSWEYSELKGLEVTAIDSGYDSNAKERVVHGNSDGLVALHLSGNTFNGTEIPWTFQSTYTDFGDIGVRKNIHRVLVDILAEGTVAPALELRYDYESSDVHQPDKYDMQQLTRPAVFGALLSTFGSPAVFFGSRTTPDVHVYTEGSGFTVSFRMSSRNTIGDAPFEIRSFKVDLTPSGRI